MNDRFSTKYRANNQILAVLKEYENEWKGLNAFARKVELLQSSMAHIDRLNTQLQQGSEARTEVKDNNMEEMIFAALLLPMP